MARRSSLSDHARLTRQLSLDLPPARGRGGARPGAGRPRKRDADRGFIAHRARPSHRKDDPVHVSLRVRRNVPSLRRQSMHKLVERALLEQRADLTKQDATHFQIVHFTIQADHLHLIVEAPNKRGLARGIAGLEVRIARRLNKLLHRKGRLWSDRYHRRDLRSPTETRNVLLNSQKHHRVIGEGAFADPYSSAATFDAFTAPPTTFATSTPWPRVEPRTWLLRVGWRRRGLIHPADIPPSSPHHTGAPA